MANSSQPSLLNLLPAAEPPVPGEGFTDQALSLAAGVAHLDGLFDFDRYQRALEACGDFFGDTGYHALIQAKLHYALLHPPRPEMLGAIARRLAAQDGAAEPAFGRLDALKKMVAHIAGPDESERVKALLALFAPPEDDVSDPLRATVRDVERGLSRLYHAAARYLPGADSGKPAPGGAALPARTGEALARLEGLSRSLADKRLAAALDALRALLRDQPFRVVAVGERKHGKSTLVNALLGRDLSPVREAVPETRLVVTFRQMEHPAMSGVFLTAEQAARRDALLSEDAGSLLLAGQMETLRTLREKHDDPPGGFVRLQTEESLREAIRGGGPLANRLGSAEVGLAFMPLGSDAVLVDTPGLNTPDPFLAWMAFEAGLSADCVLLVMDAHNPGSHSELKLMRKLTKLGRSVSVIGVLTRADQLTSPESLSAARAQARQLLDEACRASEHVKVEGVVSLNARALAVSDQRRAPREARKELAALLELLGRAKAASINENLRARKISGRLSSLSADLDRALRRRAEDSLSRMPGPELITMLEAHANQLAEASRRSLAQARDLVQLAQDDIAGWERETARALDVFKENLTLRLMAAVTETVRAAGHDFARRDIWEHFDEETAKPMIISAMDDFLKEQHEVFRAHEHRLRVCAGQMEKIAGVCLEAAASTFASLDEAQKLLAREDSPATHFLVKTHRYMEKLGLLAGGAIVGKMVANPLGMLAVAALLPKIAIAVVVGVMWGIYRLGREDKRREALLSRRSKEIADCAERVTEALRKELSAARETVTDNYASGIRDGFNPALESLLCQAAHLRLFLEMMKTLRLQAGQYGKPGHESLLALEEALAGDGICPEGTF